MEPNGAAFLLGLCFYRRVHLRTCPQSEAQGQRVPCPLDRQELGPRASCPFLLPAVARRPQLRVQPGMNTDSGICAQGPCGRAPSCLEGALRCALQLRDKVS